MRWAKAHKLTRLQLPAVRWDGPTGAIDTEARWQQARRLLHDDTLKPEDRVAGLLVLLDAQPAATISRLTLDRIETDGDIIRLRLGDEPIVIPEPLAALIRQIVASRRGHAAIGDQQDSRWLFPGGQPGRPIGAFRMAERLRQIGLHATQARSSALFQLATELPAALLARMLGVHISVAVAWQRASNGDWTTYAADISRRTPNTTPLTTPIPTVPTTDSARAHPPCQPQLRQIGRSDSRRMAVLVPRWWVETVTLRSAASPGTWYQWLSGCRGWCPSLA